MKKQRMLRFTNCKGETVTFAEGTPIAELVKRGIKVDLVPRELPPPTDPKVYVHPTR